MSMARGPRPFSPGGNEDDEAGFDSISASRQKTPRPATIDDASTPTPATGSDDYEDLVSRTRKSMAGFEAAQKKAQLERRRSQRKSRHLAPTPSRSGRFSPVEEGDGDTSVIEELMSSADVNYEAVFKSRPRIATSPGPSPVRG